MFGKRGSDGGTKPVTETRPAPAPAAAGTAPVAPPAPPPMPAMAVNAAAPASKPAREKTDNYYDTKSQVFSALIDTIDLSQLAKLDADTAREEIRDIVNDIIAIKNFAMSIAEQEELLEDICNDVLGYGPLEPLLARDDIADIMVNGAKKTYIEVAGKVP